MFSKTAEEHQKHLREVFRRLREHKLYAKASKCKFGKDQVELLWNVVSRHGLHTAKDKITAVREWPVPNDLDDVRSFLGLTGHYRRFVKDYAKTAGPLDDLKKKDAKFM